MSDSQQHQQSPTTSLAIRIYLDVLKREFNITKGVEQCSAQQLMELIRVLRLNASTLNLNGIQTPTAPTTNNGPTITNNFGMNPPPQSPSKQPIHQPHFYQPTQNNSNTTPPYQQHHQHSGSCSHNTQSSMVSPQKSSPMKRPHSSIEVISLDNSPVTSNGVTDDVIFVKAEVKPEITSTPTKRRNGRQTATTPGSSPMSSTSAGLVSPGTVSPMSTTSSQGFTTPTKQTDRKNILGPYLDGSFKMEQQPIHTPLSGNASLSFSQNASSHVPTPSFNDLANLHLDQYSQLLFSPSTSVSLSQLNINSPKTATSTQMSSQISATPSSSQVTATSMSSQIATPELKITDAATPKAHSEKKKKKESTTKSRKKKDSNPTPAASASMPADSPLATMTSPPTDSTEKRKKKFVSTCSEKLLDRIQRALTQRLFLIGRKDKKENEETFAVFGTTGNVYDVHVCQVPTCSCPDFKRGNFCKHILFVYLRVLRIPATHYVIYQKALMKSELEAIFAHAPKVLAQSLKASDDVIQNYNNLMSQDTSQLIIGQQRKTLAGAHCPICYEDFIPGKEKTDHCLVCGTNVHEECLKAWKSYDKNFPCPECKAPQFGKGQSSVLATSEGYCNLSQYQPNTPKCR